MKITQALIIRRLQVELSMQYAQMCADTCVQHGLDFEFIDAVEFLDCKEAFESVGAKIQEHYKNTRGNCCCHSSHIKCWRRIIELDEACIILEHDALVLGDVTNIDIPDMAAVTFGHRVSNIDDYSPPGPIKELIEIEKAIGVHACGLTPTTAKWLIDDAENNGVGIGVDRWLMMQRASTLPLYVCEPPQAVCWARTSTSNFVEGQHEDDRRRSSVHNYKEALTPGWFEGFND